MNSNSYITLALNASNAVQVVYAVENDIARRWIVAQLTDSGLAWTPPAGSTLMIRYRKPDDTIGAYDTLEDGSVAFQISGSVVTFALAAQALTVPGDVRMELTFFDSEGGVLTSLPFLLRVYPSVAATESFASEDYVNLLNGVMAQTAEYAAQAAASAEALAGFEEDLAYNELDPVTAPSGATYKNLTFRNAYIDSGAVWLRPQSQPLSSFAARFAYASLPDVTSGGRTYKNTYFNDTYLDAFAIWYRPSASPLSDVLAGILTAQATIQAKLTTDAGWTLLGGSYDSNNYTEYRKVNGLVEIRLVYSNAAPVGTSNPVGTLPAGYRPGKSLFVPAYVTDSELGSVNVRPGGVVDLSSPRNNGAGPFYGVVVYAPEG